MGSDETNGWREYQKLVLSELRRLDENVEKMNERIERAIKHERGNRQMIDQATHEDIRALQIEVHGLKIKAGIWGLIGGLLPVATALLAKAI